MDNHEINHLQARPPASCNDCPNCELAEVSDAYLATRVPRFRVCTAAQGRITWAENWVPEWCPSVAISA